MLTHANGKWSTSCDRCHAPIEIVGSPDKRRSKKGPELTAAAQLLISIGWSPLHRKNAAWAIEWRCKTCVTAIADRGRRSIPHSTAQLDMNPAGAKKRA